MVMNTAIYIKTNKSLKEKAFKTAKDMGLPMSIVLTRLLQKFIEDKTLSFTVTEKPSKKLERILRKADKDIKGGRNMSPVLHSVDELMADLGY